jgi:hypothetical protein
MKFDEAIKQSEEQQRKIDLKNFPIKCLHDANGECLM